MVPYPIHNSLHGTTALAVPCSFFRGQPPNDGTTDVVVPCLNDMEYMLETPHGKTDTAPQTRCRHHHKRAFTYVTVRWYAAPC